LSSPSGKTTHASLPDLDYSARSPVFQFRLTFNEQEKDLDEEMVAFLRVYTWDVIKEEISVIGSCFVPIFDINSSSFLSGKTTHCLLYQGRQCIVFSIREDNSLSSPSGKTTHAYSVPIREDNSLIEKTMHCLP
jgi:hypothetical protein